MVLLLFFLLYRLCEGRWNPSMSRECKSSILLPSPKKARRMGFGLACFASKASLFCPLCKSNLSVQISLGFLPPLLLHSRLLFLSQFPLTLLAFSSYGESAHIHITQAHYTTPTFRISLSLSSWRPHERQAGARQNSSFRNWHRRTEWVGSNWEKEREGRGGRGAADP